jgi:hypothetical protein
MQKRRHSQRQKSGGRKTQSVPEPEKGVNRVEIDEDIPVFQLILGQHLSNTGEKAIWIDSGNEASTYALSSAGSHELLHRVQIGRAFTAFQHYHIVNRIEEFLEPETRYIVMPNIDQQYRNGNVSEKEMKDLFSDLISKIESLREERPGIKILYSFFDSRPHEIKTELRQITDNSIEIERTGHGLRNKSGTREQLFYREKGCIQTTIPFWKREKHENPENTVKVEYDGKDKQYV